MSIFNKENYYIPNKEHLRAVSQLAERVDTLGNELSAAQEARIVSEAEASRWQASFHAMANRAQRAEAERDGFRRQVIAGVYDAASVGMTLIQTEKLDMLKADAERYRWLRDCGLHHQIIGRITQSVGCGPYIAMRLPSTTSFNTVELDAGAADAAIDAAMKESKT